MKGHSLRNTVPSQGPSRRRRNRKLFLERLEDRALLATFSVVNTAASGAGSLRQAILDANANAGADVIEFNIPADDVNHVYYKNDGVAGKVTLANIVPTTASNDATIADIDPDWAHSWYRIKPTSASPLPTITGPVTMDGYTQPGSAANTSALGGNEVLRIELDGTSAGATANGLTITAGSSTIRGLAINRFMVDGVQLQAVGGNVIEGNHIGTDVSGKLANHNRRYGIQILGGSSGNIVGTDGDGVNDLGERNVISANLTANVYITGAGSDHNVVAGNFIGTNAAGAAGFSMLSNAASYGNGVWIDAGSQNNRIGTDGNGIGDLAERNIISDNAGYGYSSSTVEIRSSGVLITGASTTQNVVAGNFIGTDVTGTLALQNGSSFGGSVIMGGGIVLKDTRDNRIGTNADGSGDAAERNVVSANNRGIRLLNSSNISIAGNYIGTDATGSVDRGNNWGVQLVASSHNTIGGTAPAARNVISGNSAGGVVIIGAASTNNVVQGNFVGTDVTGTAAIANGQAGVWIDEGQHTLVGGVAAGAGNLLSGNERGVHIQGTTATTLEGYNVVEGNLIGTDVTGTRDLGSLRQGVLITASDNNRIGGTAPGARNIISGNNGGAIEILGSLSGVTSAEIAIGNVIQGNWLGLDVTGNVPLGPGSVAVRFATDTLIGGTVPGARNYIAEVRGNGLSIQNSMNTVVQGNVLGQTLNGSPAGFFLDGIDVQNSWNTLIGGVEPGAGNVITNGGNEYGPSPNLASRGPSGVSIGPDVNPGSWWRAENNAQNAVLNGNHGTLQGGATFAPGKHGYAFQFDGIDDYVDLGDRLDYGGGEFSLEAWIRPNRVDRQQQIISKFGPGGNTYQIGLTSTGALQAQASAGTVIHTLESGPGAVEAGEWAHVAMTFDNSPREWKLYLNGVEVDSMALGGPNSSSTTPLSFGRKSDGTEHFDGLIDELAIWGTTGSSYLPLRYLTGGVNQWHGTTIRGNSIFNNGDMGIDLMPHGPNPTDSDDTDVGANDKQNVPEILSATSDGIQVTVQGVLHSIPFATYALDFYANSEPPPPRAEIEGEQFIGFGTVVTDATGTANFEFTFDVAVPVDYLISTTATVMSDHDSNPDTALVGIATSEFSGPKIVLPKSGGRIQGFKFNDANENGQLDTGEHGLFDWTIYLDANNNGVLDTGERRDITSTNGAYAFTNLAAGTYYVREVQKTGWTQTTPDVVEVVVTDPQTRPIYTVNIGNHRVESLVSGLKFHDLDGDGTRDAGEPGLSGFAIYIDANGNDERDSGELATVSDINGVWGFENLVAGTYRIREVQKTGWVQTTPPLADVTLTANGQSADAGIIGNYQLATISGAKFNDRNADGQHQPTEPGLFAWTIYIDANDNGQLDVGEPSDTTNQFGAYSFSGLAAGSYIVREVQQNGWEQTTDDVTVEVLPNQSGQEYTVLVGNFRPSSIIGGVKFHDVNGNGTRDTSEPGLANWTITLDTDADGSADRLAITNADGEYTFTGLPAGTYRIREIQQNGWVQTTDNPADIVISDGGQVIAGPSFGNYQLATISGVKFCDCNGNGLLDPGENGLAGWTIFLDDNDNGLLDDGEASDVTNFDGGYSFSNLVEGEYRVREVQQSGWEQTTPNMAVEVLPDLSAQAYAVNIGNAEDHHSSGICVTNTNDSGPGSLRQAMLDANANPDHTFICFSMNADDPGHVYYRDDGVAGQVSPGNITVTSASDDAMITDFDPDHPHSWWRIIPTSALPNLTRPTTIDGYTQAGSSVNTLTGGLNTVLRIELNGSLAGSVSSLAGVRFDADDSAVLGLSINSFWGAQIQAFGHERAVVEGNFIGVDPSGTRAGTNQGRGVSVFVASNGRIGTNADGICDLAERNLISGNTYGVDLSGGTGYVVAGNLVGTDITGTRALPNVSLAAITVQHKGATIGGTAEVARNVVSGNASGGISITNSFDGATNKVQGNFVGVDVTGTRPLGNGSYGISAGFNSGTTQSTLIGGTEPGARNIVSANGSTGIILSNNGTAQAAPTVQGNYVGTDVTGLVDLGNLQNGILGRGLGHQIGGSAPGAGNLISGNGQNGVSIGDTAAAAINVYLEGNRIGINADGTGFLGNSQNGVFITNSSTANVVGGTGAGAGNVIAGNTLAGVRVASGTGNPIRGNTIHSNGGLGIDLGTAGITLNDLMDPDAGANDLQNFPLISAAASFGTGTVVSGSLNSTANTTFTLDFYANGIADPSGFGEGQTYLGSAQVTTDGSGEVTFSVVVSGTVAAGQFVTATATNPAGSTSEFSGNRTVTAYVPATIAGQKFNDLDEDGSKDTFEPGLPGWTIFLDANGNDMLDAGETNVVTDSSGNYDFPGLLPGAYRVREVQQPGWTQTTANPPDIVVLLGGATFSNVDFGNHEVGSRLVGTFIVGQKFYDANSDGVKNPGEVGLGHWSFFLDLDNDGLHQLYIEPQTYADSEGNYSFAVTSPGTYRVREIPQPGWFQTTPNPTDIVVSGHGQVFEVNFGNNRDERVTLISGHKFRDQDGDGIQDPGEPGISWWPIYVDTNFSSSYEVGEPLTFTNIGGNYAFSGLPEGTYRIRELQRPGWTQTTANPADVVVHTAGQTIGGIDFGNMRDAQTLIAGRKYFDSNKDGTFDPGEPGLAWWPIFIDTNSSGSYEVGEPLTHTDWNGGYSFVGLPPGTYRVRERQYPGWTQTSDDPADIVITANGQMFEDVNFGNHRPDPTIISGQKFEDVNDNGIKDSGEPGVHYWPIYIDANLNDAYDAGEQYTLTNWQGNYSFVGVAPGTYRIREVPHSPEWRQTTVNPAEVEVTSTGQLFVDRDFGNFRRARITGLKFADTNANGLLDPGETGLGGWTIFLDANDNGILDSGEAQTTTGPFGGYAFNNLEPGTYYVREVQQPGWTQTSPNVTTEVVSNQSSQSYAVNVGNFRWGSIDGGVKYHDLNGNGLFDANEPGLPGWTIYLDQNENAILDADERRTVSDLNGRWSFRDLPAGTYHVREVQENGWVQTSAPLDLTIASSGQSVADAAIGNYRLATVSGVKFNDRNGDGVLQAGEPGLEGWTIFLDTNDNGSLDGGERSTTTNLFGGYTFGNLMAGTYRVREVQQPGWTQTSPNVTTGVVPNQSAQSYVVDVGNFRWGSIDGGVKYHDLNGNGLLDANEPGLPGWTIYLDQNENAILDADERRTVSDLNGRWSFRDLPAGTYHVREVQENGWVQTSAPLDLTIASSSQSVADAAIGNYRLATISGVKFHDRNGDGVLQAGEPGLEGWTIFLDTNDNGSPDVGEASTTTNLFGGYAFGNLIAGTYRVREVQQPGWTQTSPNVTTVVVPNQSAQSYVVNVGNFQLGTMEGVKFHDYNGNGHRDVNEPGLPGWTIYLDDNRNDAFDEGESTSITDPNGNWSFGNLPAGDYHVREVQQPGWVQTSAPLDLTLATSGEFLTGAIGNFRLSTITGVKFHDLNGNAERDPGEPGIEGWQIFLDLDGDDALDANERSTFTNAFGVYSFPNVGPGTWTAREVQDPGWLQTTVNPPSVTVVGPQQTFAGGDFGNKQGSLSGSVYIDADNDGVFDVDEEGIENVLITLSGNDDLGPVTRTVLTGTDGSYKFGGLRPGSYQIIETQPSGYLDGKDTLGSLGHTVANDQFFVDLEKGEDGTAYNFGELQPARLSGYVYDDQDNDGEIDFGEPAISGVAIHLTGRNDLNQIIDQIVSTDTQGYYEFSDLRPGTYTITEQHPVPYIDGEDTVGTLGGTATNDQFAAIPVINGSNGINYNFGEHLDAGLKRGQTATIGFWQNKNGQKLLLSLNGGANSTSLGNWLSTNFANMYGANAGANNLAGKTNAEIADFYIRLFKQKGQKLDAQVLAAAFAVYVTDTGLAATNAAQYGFIVNSAGTGAATFNVGTSGAAFGVGDNSRLTILQILTATNALSSGGNLYHGNTNLRNLAIIVYDGINRGGDIL